MASSSTLSMSAADAKASAKALLNILVAAPIHSDAKRGVLFLWMTQKYGEGTPATLTQQALLQLLPYSKDFERVLLLDAPRRDLSYVRAIVRTYVNLVKDSRTLSNPAKYKALQAMRPYIADEDGVPMTLVPATDFEGPHMQARFFFYYNAYGNSDLPEALVDEASTRIAKDIDHYLAETEVVAEEDDMPYLRACMVMYILISTALRSRSVAMRVVYRLISQRGRSDALMDLARNSSREIRECLVGCMLWIYSYGGGVNYFSDTETPEREEPGMLIQHLRETFSTLFTMRTDPSAQNVTDSPSFPPRNAGAYEWISNYFVCSGKPFFRAYSAFSLSVMLGVRSCMQEVITPDPRESTREEQAFAAANVPQSYEELHDRIATGSAASKKRVSRQLAPFFARRNKANVVSCLLTTRPWRLSKMVDPTEDGALDDLYFQPPLGALGTFDDDDYAVSMSFSNVSALMQTQAMFSGSLSWLLERIEKGVPDEVMTASMLGPRSRSMAADGGFYIRIVPAGAEVSSRVLMGAPWLMPYERPSTSDTRFTSEERTEDEPGEGGKVELRTSEAREQDGHLFISWDALGLALQDDDGELPEGIEEGETRQDIERDRDRVLGELRRFAQRGNTIAQLMIDYLSNFRLDMTSRDRIRAHASALEDAKEKLRDIRDEEFEREEEAKAKMAIASSKRLAAEAEQVTREAEETSAKKPRQSEATSAAGGDDYEEEEEDDDDDALFAGAAPATTTPGKKVEAVDDDEEEEDEGVDDEEDEDESEDEDYQSEDGYEPAEGANPEDEVEGEGEDEEDEVEGEGEENESEESPGSSSDSEDADDAGSETNEIAKIDRQVIREKQDAKKGEIIKDGRSLRSTAYRRGDIDIKGVAEIAYARQMGLPIPEEYKTKAKEATKPEPEAEVEVIEEEEPEPEKPKSKKSKRAADDPEEEEEQEGDDADDKKKKLRVASSTSSATLEEVTKAMRSCAAAPDVMYAVQFKKAAGYYSELDTEQPEVFKPLDNEIEDYDKIQRAALVEEGYDIYTSEKVRGQDFTKEEAAKLNALIKQVIERRDGKRGSWCAADLVMQGWKNSNKAVAVVGDGGGGGADATKYVALDPIVVKYVKYQQEKDRRDYAGIAVDDKDDPNFEMGDADSYANDYVRESGAKERLLDAEYDFVQKTITDAKQVLYESGRDEEEVSLICLVLALLTSRAGSAIALKLMSIGSEALTLEEVCAKRRLTQIIVHRNLKEIGVIDYTTRCKESVKIAKNVSKDTRTYQSDTRFLAMTAEADANASKYVNAKTGEFDMYVGAEVEEVNKQVLEKMRKAVDETSDLSRMFKYKGTEEKPNLGKLKFMFSCGTLRMLLYKETKTSNADIAPSDQFTEEDINDAVKPDAMDVRMPDAMIEEYDNEEDAGDNAEDDEGNFDIELSACQREMYLVFRDKCKGEDGQADLEWMREAVKRVLTQPGPNGEMSDSALYGYIKREMEKHQGAQNQDPWLDLMASTEYKRYKEEKERIEDLMQVQEYITQELREHVEPLYPYQEDFPYTLPTLTEPPPGVSQDSWRAMQGKWGFTTLTTAMYAHHGIGYKTRVSRNPMWRSRVITSRGRYFGIPPEIDGEATAPAAASEDVEEDEAEDEEEEA